MTLEVLEKIILKFKTMGCNPRLRSLETLEKKCINNRRLWPWKSLKKVILKIPDNGFWKTLKKKIENRRLWPWKSLKKLF